MEAEIHNPSTLKGWTSKSLKFKANPGYTVPVKIVIVIIVIK